MNPDNDSSGDPPTDGSQPHLDPKKERVIQPLDKKSGKAAVIPGASDDLLAELRAKTAELAKSVKGDEEPPERTLVLDEPDPDDEIKISENSAGTPQSPNLSAQSTKKNSPAVQLVRDKLTKLYKSEPDAAEEALDAEQAGKRRSKHQQFMYDLTTSGKSLADIQTEWHNYYVDLPDDEKHSVWKEFYSMQRQTSEYVKAENARKPKKKDKKDKHQQEAVVAGAASQAAMSPGNDRSVAAIKSQLIDKVNANGRLKPIHHFKSLLFGLGLASAVALIITFTFFNEVFIAPFISPSQNVSASPIIGPQSGKVSDEAKIIIPKINLEVPVVFGLDSIDEKTIQNSLEDGVVHYASTPNPGEKGNAVIVGHSSNNILNSGKYKFAFVLLKRLEVDDVFYVQKDGVRYTYKVYKKEIVPPTDVSVLQTQEKANTITLITCDPPGTSINRLVIVAEQIDPDPAGNKASTAVDLEVSEEALPSNAPSLWSRLWPF